MSNDDSFDNILSGKGISPTPNSGSNNSGDTNSGITHATEGITHEISSLTRETYSRPSDNEKE